MAFKVFQYQTVISESGLDSFGHLNNAVYLRYFEDARWALMHEGNFTVDTIRSQQQGPVILEVNLRFRRELKGGEKIVIETQVTEQGPKISRLLQQMKLPDGQVAAEAQYVMGFFDMKKRKLIAPTSEWLRVIGISN